MCRVTEAPGDVPWLADMDIGRHSAPSFEAAWTIASMRSTEAFLARSLIWRRQPTGSAGVAGVRPAEGVEHLRLPGAQVLGQRTSRRARVGSRSADRRAVRWPEHAAFMDGLVNTGLVVLGGPLDANRGVPRRSRVEADLRPIECRVGRTRLGRSGQGQPPRSSVPDTAKVRSDRPAGRRPVPSPRARAPRTVREPRSAGTVSQ